VVSNEVTPFALYGLFPLRGRLSRPSLGPASYNMAGAILVASLLSVKEEVWVGIKGIIVLIVISLIIIKYFNTLTVFTTIQL
jgi:hypothetical protein